MSLCVQPKPADTQIKITFHSIDWWFAVHLSSICSNAFFPFGFSPKINVPNFDIFWAHCFGFRISQSVCVCLTWFYVWELKSNIFCSLIFYYHNMKSISFVKPSALASNRIQRRYIEIEAKKERENREKMINQCVFGIASKIKDYLINEKCHL